jgi:hypothetical protein
MTASFYVGAYWKERPQTLREYIAQSKRFLVRLRDVHPVFLKWMSWGRTPDSAVALLEDLSNLEELVFHRALGEESLFVPSAPDGSPTLDSTCPHGFSTSYATGQDAEGPSVSITTGATSPWLNDSVVIELPTVSEFGERGVVKKLLEVMVENWSPRTVVVSSHAFNRKLNGMDAKLPIVGWMIWLADRSARDVLPPGVQSESHAGGLLVRTTRELFCSESPDQVATARQIRDQLREYGFLD